MSQNESAFRLRIEGKISAEEYVERLREKVRRRKQTEREARSPDPLPLAQDSIGEGDG